MATRICLKRAKLLAKFPLSSAARTFCIASAEVEKNNQDVSQGKKKKEKDIAKVLAYEQYRENLENTRAVFRAEYEKKQAKERKRLEELNRGSFSPIEQHKKAMEDIRIYNEKKGITRITRQEERRRRMEVQIEKQRQENNAKQREINRQLVLQVIEESKSFVTMENLEEKIQEVLMTEINYNFALTANRRKIMSREPPNNLGRSGPGPAAYQGSGLKFRTMTKQDSWKTRWSVDDDINEDDINGDDNNEDDSNKSGSSGSSSSDSESSDDDVEKATER